MKLISLTLATAMSAAALAQTPAVTPKKVTEQDLALRLRKAELGDLQKKSESQDMADPSKGSRPKSLLDTSTILNFGGSLTLVPKGAVLHVPKTLTDRVGKRDGAKIATWTDFQTANRGWLITQEVTLEQAKGNESLPEAVLQHLAKEINVVVATYQGRPISMLKFSEASTASAQP